MIRIENTETYGWKAAVRGMRNPKNSWNRSDSYAIHIENEQTLNTADFAFFMGDNDMTLAKALVDGGPVHAKFRRMITVTADITAPFYW